MEELRKHINSFEGTNLGEMNAIKLLNRQDTKYVFHRDQLLDVLDDLKPYYKSLEIDGTRILSYENQYYDTKDFLFYNKHQRGMLNRTKVRIRKYVESDLSFIEVKTKTNKSRTVKKRIPLEGQEHLRSERIIEFVDSHSPITVEKLEEEMRIDFQRITLAHKDLKDRCTLDINLKAKWRGKEFSFDNLVIAELKQERFKHSSPFNLTLKKHRIYSESFSKYCFSFLHLNNELKRNNFNERLHHLNKKILNT